MATAQAARFYACDICEDEEDARWYCRECDQNLCEKCKKLHLKTTVSKGHQVLDIAERYSVEKPLINQDVKCTEHRDDTCSLFCDDCNVPVCTSCVTSSHNGHTYSKLKSATEKEHKLLQENLAKKKKEFEEFKKAVELNRKACDNYCDEISKLEKEVNDRAEEWKKMAEAFKERSLKDLQYSKKNIEFEKSLLDKKYDSLNAKMQEEVEKSQKALNHKASYDTLSKARKSLGEIDLIQQNKEFEVPIFKKKVISEKELYSIFGLPTSETTSKEVALLNKRASVLIYSKEKEKWEKASLTGGISGVGLYHLPSKNKYRIVGRDEKTGEVTVNSPLYKNMKYEKKTDIFIQWKDPVRLYGLVFSKASDTKDFCGCLVKVLDTLNDTKT